jgi:hypothetical protein
MAPHGSLPPFVSLPERHGGAVSLDGRPRDLGSMTLQQRMEAA